MSFRDFKVNNISVDVKNIETVYFKKTENIVIPRPATVFIPARRLLTAAWTR